MKKQDFMENGYDIIPKDFYTLLRQNKITLHQFVIINYILNCQSFATQSNICKMLNLNNRIVKKSLDDLKEKRILQFAQHRNRTFYRLEEYQNIKKMIS